MPEVVFILSKGTEVHRGSPFCPTRFVGSLVTASSWYNVYSVARHFYQSFNATETRGVIGIASLQYRSSTEIVR